MTYADKIIAAFGGPRKMARRLDKPVSTVNGWSVRGQIPDDSKAQILVCAREDGLPIGIIDLFPVERLPLGFALVVSGEDAA